jgi:hypothetical protein
MSINFNAQAVLRKWPSVNSERVSGSQPYLLVEGSLDECLRHFMAKPTAQRHLYVIYTYPQSDIVTAVLSAEQIVEIAKLRDFL